MEQRLKVAFKGYANFEGCVENVNHDSFKVFDFENECCRIVQSGELKDKQHEETLDVINPNNKIIYCLSTDQCLLKTVDGEKCDCVLFDDKTIIFVEMKTNASTQIKVTLEKECNHAIEQILSINRLFIQKKVIFDEYRKLGIICFKKIILTGAIRRNNTTFEAMRNNFLRQNSFGLNITNRVEFR